MSGDGDDPAAIGGDTATPSRAEAPVVFGAFARTPRGRDQLTTPALARWLGASEDGASGDWWIDRAAGVALWRPQLVLASDGKAAEAVLSIRGSVFAERFRSEPSAGWARAPSADGTAALLYDFLERGERAIDSLRGQFSLAFWDGQRQRLILARDHLGQRSIFLHTGPDLTIFCSDLAPLLRPPGDRCELDHESAFFYLAFGMPSPGRTLARRVDRVPAAHLLLWEPERPPLTRRYWTPLDPDAPRQATPEVVERIRDALDRSVAARVDVNGRQGLFLSGGMDSTYLAATATALGVSPLYAFTAEFEADHGLNETEYASLVCGWLGLPQDIVTLGAPQGLELLRDVVLAAAEPCSAWASLAHLRILAWARQRGVGSLLSGLGADEIFGGYDHFRGYYARLLRHARRGAGVPGMDAFAAVLQPESQASRRVMFPGVARFFDDAALRDGLEEPYRRWQYASYLRAFYRECRRLKPEAEPMEMMVAHECQHRIPDLLFANFEPFSRSLGIDVRYPFLDPDVIRLVAGLAAESRYRAASGQFSLRLRRLQPRFKHAMLLVAAGRVPEEILARPRKSFTAPFGAWMFDSRFGPFVIAALRRSRFWDLGIVRRSWLDRILDRIVAGPNPWVFQLWVLVTLAGWYDRYVEAPGDSTVASSRGTPPTGA